MADKKEHLFSKVPILHEVRPVKVRRTGKFRRTSKIRDVHEYQAIKSDKLLIFSHFDSEGRINKFARYYLSQIRKDLECSIIVSSTCSKIDLESQEFLASTVNKLIVRENVGLDFGSWKQALENIDSSRLSWLFLANDSVLGPFHSLRPFIEKNSNVRDPLVLGITDSWQRNYHLQSYFLAANRACLNHQGWIRFWRDTPYYIERQDVIENCEIGLSQKLLEAGVKLGAHFSFEETYELLADERTNPDKLRISDFNPTLRIWDYLLENNKSPFVKRAIFQAHEANAENYIRLKRLVSNIDFPLEDFLLSLQVAQDCGR